MLGHHGLRFFLPQSVHCRPLSGYLDTSRGISDKEKSQSAARFLLNFYFFISLSAFPLILSTVHAFAAFPQSSPWFSCRGCICHDSRRFCSCHHAAYIGHSSSPVDDMCRPILSLRHNVSVAWGNVQFPFLPTPPWCMINVAYNCLPPLMNMNMLNRDLLPPLASQFL